MSEETVSFEPKTLTRAEAVCVEAISAEIIPSDPEGPGAREARVIEFIDRALREEGARWLDLYQAGVARLNAWTVDRYGAPFASLDESSRHEVMNGLATGDLPGEDGEWAKALFEMVWQHTVQGFLADPEYGGNRDLVGWKTVGFPGARYGYAEEDAVYGHDLSGKTILSLTDMRELSRREPGKFYTPPDVARAHASED